MRSALLLALLAPACIAPSVVDSSGRAVESAAEELAWRDAQPRDFDGLFESTAIEGEAAAVIGRIYYHFSPAGSYTGAALVIGGAEPEFQTLSGRWTLGPDGLDLGDGVPVRASASEGHLRLASDGGVVTLQRQVIE
jgi:hypothetical protein